MGSIATISTCCMATNATIGGFFFRALCCGVIVVPLFPFLTGTFLQVPPSCPCAGSMRGVLWPMTMDGRVHGEPLVA